MTSLPGSGSAAVALSVSRLQRADDALRHTTALMLDEKAHVDPLGYVKLSGNFFEEVPVEITIRFLSDVFKIVRGRSDPIKLLHIEQLLERLIRSEVPAAMTMAGCQMRPFKDEWILCREPGRSALPVISLNGARQVIWDNRFIVMDHGDGNQREITKNFTVRALGDDGWRQIIESALPNYVKKLPSMVRKNLPAIWNNGEIVDMPLFSGHKTALGIAKGRFEMVFIPKMKHQKQGV